MNRLSDNQSVIQGAMSGILVIGLLPHPVSFGAEQWRIGQPGKTEEQRRPGQPLPSETAHSKCDRQEEIDDGPFPGKHTEMPGRFVSIRLQLDALDRSQVETAELASKVFELSKTLAQQWLAADYAAPRRILEIV